jgi:low affinity Fe/Cu permease
LASKSSRLEQIGCRISELVADISAHPVAQVGVLLICVAWFLLALRVDILTAGLSILAITLSQMVLNRQGEREKDAHRRDVALHAKLDELLHASRRARDELAGIEELEEDQIEALKEGNVTPLPTSRKARTKGA